MLFSTVIQTLFNVYSEDSGTMAKSLRFHLEVRTGNIDMSAYSTDYHLHLSHYRQFGAIQFTYRS